MHLNRTTVESERDRLYVDHEMMAFYRTGPCPTWSRRCPFYSMELLSFFVKVSETLKATSSGGRLRRVDSGHFGSDSAGWTTVDTTVSIRLAR